MALVQTLSFVLGIIGNAISIMVFACPLPTFWRVFKSKSTQDFKSLPYVCTLLSTSLWTYYGLIKPNGTLIFTINAAGTVFEAFYLLLFLIFSPKNKKIQTSLLIFLLNIVFFGVVFVFTMFLIHDISRKLLVVGVLCATISVSMYAAPLGVMKTVIRTRSVEYMPLLLSIFLFLNGIVWSAYAFLVKDIFVEIPNVIGVVLGVAQLLLYFIYRKDKHHVKTDGPLNGDEKMIECTSLENREAPTNSRESGNTRDSNTSLPKHHSIPKVIRTASSNLSNMINIMVEDSSKGVYERVSKKTDA